MHALRRTRTTKGSSISRSLNTSTWEHRLSGSVHSNPTHIEQRRTAATRQYTTTNATNAYITQTQRIFVPFTTKHLPVMRGCRCCRVLDRSVGLLQLLVDGDDGDVGVACVAVITTERRVVCGSIVAAVSSSVWPRSSALSFKRCSVVSVWDSLGCGIYSFASRARSSINRSS